MNPREIRVIRVPWSDPLSSLILADPRPVGISSIREIRVPWSVIREIRVPWESEIREIRVPLEF